MRVHTAGIRSCKSKSYYIDDYYDFIIDDYYDFIRKFGLNPAAARARTRSRMSSASLPAIARFVEGIAPFIFSPIMIISSHPSLIFTDILTGFFGASDCNGIKTTLPAER
jgi:hypothetical protein